MDHYNCIVYTWWSLGFSLPGTAHGATVSAFIPPSRRRRHATAGSPPERHSSDTRSRLEREGMYDLLSVTAVAIARMWEQKLPLATAGVPRRACHRSKAPASHCRMNGPYSCLSTAAFSGVPPACSRSRLSLFTDSGTCSASAKQVWVVRDLRDTIDPSASVRIKLEFDAILRARCNRNRWQN